MITGIPVCLKIDRPVYSMLLSWVIDKQYDSFSGLITSFVTTVNLITFYRRKYNGHKIYIYFFFCPNIYAKYGSLYIKNVTIRDDGLRIQAIRGAGGRNMFILKDDRLQIQAIREGGGIQCYSLHAGYRIYCGF